MRSVLSTVLLLFVIAVGQVGAVELTAAQAQLIFSVGKGISARDGVTVVKQTVHIGEVDVVFNVTRDALGTIIARPEVSATNANAGIAQVSISTDTDLTTGGLVPKSVVQINTDNTIVGYVLSRTGDGAISELFRGDGFRNPNSPFYRNINSLLVERSEKYFANNEFEQGTDFYIGNLFSALSWIHLPAGTGTTQGKPVSPYRPGG